MKKFNKDKYLKKLKFKRFFQEYSKFIYAFLVFFLCCLLGIYFTYSKFFVSNEQEIIKSTVGSFIRGDIIINIYKDNKLVELAPEKEDGYAFKEATCNNGNAVWSLDEWKLTIKNFNSRIKCNIYFEKSSIYKFEYSKSETTFIVPEDGLYKLEVWGAQGGVASSTGIGGYGGYSSGYINLVKDSILYINVGGMGSCSIGSTTLGGYNGGGNSKSRSSSYNMCSGGGATHIAAKSGLLSSLENNRESILIVAGGGGGASVFSSTSSPGGSGGGISGVVPKSTCTNCGTRTAGTQTEGGTGRGGNGFFGQGGGSTSSASNGGGGGYYGGSGDSYEWAATGGSGYIGNSLLSDKVMYCYNCSESSEIETKTITTTCKEELPTKNCAKGGSGYVKITYLGKN